MNVVCVVITEHGFTDGYHRRESTFHGRQQSQALKIFLFKRLEALAL